MESWLGYLSKKLLLEFFNIEILEILPFLWIFAFNNG